MMDASRSDYVRRSYWPIYFPVSPTSTIAMISPFSGSANPGQASSMRARSCLLATAGANSPIPPIFV